MYRISNFVSAEASFHFLVSTLIHRGGWTLVDARINAVFSTSWPLPSEPVPDMTGTTWAVVRPPSAALASCGDRFYLTLDAEDSEIQVVAFRKSGGTVVAWDAVAHEPAVGATDVSQWMAVGSPQEYLYSNESSFVFAPVDPDDSLSPNGVFAGYLQSLVSSSTGGTSLGAGADPYPLALFSMSNSFSADPVRLTELGQGSMFDSGGNALSIAGATLQQGNLFDAGLLDRPIEYGGAVPTQVLSRLLIMAESEPGSELFSLRGGAPCVFLTSARTTSTVLRVADSGAEFLVLASHVAVGPL